jgi:hypothetical protein
MISDPSVSVRPEELVAAGLTAAALRRQNERCVRGYKPAGHDASP